MSAGIQDIHSFWKQKLEERANAQSLRKLQLHDIGVDFFSNDYLGFAKSKASASQYLGGATGSRLISGNTHAHEALEEQLAEMFGCASALLYNSGFDANMGLFSCIASRTDIIIYDEYAHASIRDGVRLSPSRSFSFRHNDLSDLSRKLEKASGRVVVAVEAIYSMDGDEAALLEIAGLCKAFNAHLVVDEAHALGIYEKGLCHALALPCKQLTRVVTFGKALGYHGAAVLTDTVLKQYLINFSRSFIYTTAMPANNVEALSHLLSTYECSTKERDQLKGNIALFRKSIDPSHLSEACEGPIQIIKAPGTQAKSIEQFLMTKGFLVKAVLHPTVPAGQERLRICLHSFNTPADIENLCHHINSFEW